MSNIYLSIIVPSYNEKTNLRKGVLDKIEHFLSKQKYESEVIIVDDGSIDGSIELVEEFIKDNSRFNLIKTFHFGKAGAVTSGMLKAKGEYALFMDMDQATPVEEATKLLPFVEEYDIVIGSRGSKRQGDPWTRLLMARGMMVLRSIIVGLRGIQDTQCGFKLFRKDVSDNLFSKLEKFHNGYKQISGSSVKAGFDVELLFLAQKLGYKVKEVPVEWFYVESRRVSPIRDSIEGVEDLIRIRLNDIAGKYKTV